MSSSRSVSSTTPQKGPAIKLSSGSLLNAGVPESQRRRTLQTVSELSEYPMTSDDFGVIGETFSRKRTTRSSKMNQRSLPYNVASADNGLRSQPSIKTTSAAPPSLCRSLTDPMDRRRGTAQSIGRSNSERLSAGFSLRKQHAQDQTLTSVSEKSPLATKNQSRDADLELHSRTAFGEKRSSATRDPRSDPWSQNHRRAMRTPEARSKLLQAEQAREKAHTRRDGRGILLGSPSTLPSMSSTPMQKPKQKSINDFVSQEKLLPHSRTTTDRRHSRQFPANNHSDPRRRSADGQHMKRFSTEGNLFPSSMHQQQYSLNPLGHTTFVYPVTQPVRSPPPRSFSSPIPQGQYIRDARHSSTQEALEVPRTSDHTRSQPQAKKSRPSSQDCGAVHRHSNASTILYDENPDKRGIGFSSGCGPRLDNMRLLREKEKLLRWKAEGEKGEFERREKTTTQERVQRANELEQEKERELLKERRAKKTAGKRWSCGWFGG